MRPSRGVLGLWARAQVDRRMAFQARIGSSRCNPEGGKPMQSRSRLGFSWAAAAIITLTGGKADADMLKGYPDAIVCDAGDSRIVAYLAAVKDDGSALYKPPLADIY